MHSSLPPGYGIGIDERCIEYPWLMAHLQSGSEIVLDAGSALNHAFIVDHPVFEKKKLHVLTLAPEDNCFWKKGISYLFEDLRELPLRDSHYDTIVCISTLEHVGCDNTIYTHNEADREQRPTDFIGAMQELSRVLKPGGRLIITVPFGSYRNFGSFQQFDRQLLSRAIAAFGEASTVRESFYRYTVQGWDVATAEECVDCEYVEWVAKLWSGAPWPAPLPCEPDFAAAARAVACIELTKPAPPRIPKVSIP
jgi:SAM-dependent methyltransferase